MLALKLCQTEDGPNRFRVSAPDQLLRTSPLELLAFQIFAGGIESAAYAMYQEQVFCPGLLKANGLYRGHTY